MDESSISITALDSIGSFGIGSGSLGSLNGEYPDMFGYGTMPPGAAYYNTPVGPSPAEQYYPIPYDPPPAQKYYAPHGSNPATTSGTAEYFMAQVSASIAAVASAESAAIHTMMTSSATRFVQQFNPISSAHAAPPPRRPWNKIAPVSLLGDHSFPGMMPALLGAGVHAFDIVGAIIGIGASMEPGFDTPASFLYMQMANDLNSGYEGRSMIGLPIVSPGNVAAVNAGVSSDPSLMLLGVQTYFIDVGNPLAFGFMGPEISIDSWVALNENPTMWDLTR